jgi:ATP-dependent protease HslVU (ClpYQ) ATPase subunit
MGQKLRNVYSSRSAGMCAKLCVRMNQKQKLDIGARRLMDIFERQAAGLTVAERKAKWNAFNEIVAKVDTRAKSEEKSKTLRSLQPSRKQASL